MAWSGDRGLLAAGLVTACATTGPARQQAARPAVTSPSVEVPPSAKSPSVMSPSAAAPSVSVTASAPPEASGSAGYNAFQHSSGGASEALWRETIAYRYFAFIRYNVPAG